MLSHYQRLKYVHDNLVASDTLFKLKFHEADGFDEFLSFSAKKRFLGKKFVSNEKRLAASDEDSFFIFFHF